jgi:hypothetical protein
LIPKGGIGVAVWVLVIALISWIARPGFQMMLGANFLDGAAVDEVVS